MVPWNRVATILAGATCEELRHLVATAHSRFPVIDDDQVVGVVHAKDLFGVDDSALATTLVGVLARPALAVPETAQLRSVLAALRREATEMAVVVDEYGAPAGVVTLEDLVEELVGDIADEYDAAAPSAERNEDGSWAVPGSWRIDEVERVTGVVLPTDAAYETLAGLVLTRRQRIPAVGDRVEVRGAVLEVTAMDGWAVTRVRVIPPGPDPADTGPTSDAAGGPDESGGRETGQ